MKKSKLTSLYVILGFWLLLVLIIGGWWVSTSNRINNQKQDCDAQWSQVQNVMQRRADLIPNLTASVKGSMHNEQKIFSSIAASRRQFINADSRKEKMKADDRLNSNVNTLINAVHEQYPELDSNENVRSLMIELEGSENRISVERRNYIQDVKTYNRTVTNFPSSVVASVKGSHKLDYFKASSTAQNAPKVNLE